MKRTLILAACKSIATDNNHGHMTSFEISNHLFNNGIKHKYSRLVSFLSKHTDWWREGLPRKFRNNCLIRELKESIWNPVPQLPIAVEMDSLRYQLGQSNKHRDALRIKYDQAVVRANKYMSELNRIRHAYREFQNLMQDRR